MLEDVLREWGAEEVSAMDVYTDIFRLGEGCIQRSGEDRNGKSNPLVYMKNNGTEHGQYRVLLEDTFEQTLKEAQGYDFAIVNGLTYFGRKNVSAASHKMYAMIFDLDGVTDDSVFNFMSGAFRAKVYPVPNYIILSGHGLHLYYVFEDPIYLYAETKTKLKELKYELTRKMWNRYTSKIEKPQIQGCNQGFRPIGGKTKIDGIRVRAFRVSDHQHTMESLAEYVPDVKIDKKKRGHLTLDEARKLYPEWYQRRIVEGDTSKGRWTCKPDLYEWWIRRVMAGATYGHRYFDIMCLAIYAVKCGISEDRLKRDAYGLIPFMNEVAPKELFTEADVKSALECYDERYVRFPRDDIERISAIRIDKNRRNGRKQADHIKLMNYVRDEINHNTDWRQGNGRPSKRDTVIEWRMQNPTGRKCDCRRDTGLSRPTIDKYW